MCATALENGLLSLHTHSFILIYCYYICTYTKNRVRLMNAVRYVSLHIDINIYCNTTESNFTILQTTER